MPQAVPVVPARRSRVLLTSFAATLAVFVAIAAILAFGAKDADAATYTLTATAPTTLWSDTTKWIGGPAGTYPGQSSGDTAVIALNGFSLNIDVPVTNPVTLQITASSVSISVLPSGSLLLASGSSANSANSLTINGGTFGVASGQTVSNYDLPITVNSGTFNVAGALSINAGRTLKLSGGITQGGGTLTIPSGAILLIDCSNGGTSMLGTTVANAGTLNYTCGSPNVFALDSGSVINNSGTLSLQTDQNFSGDTLSSINNTGTISKSGGTSTTFVPVVNNSGTLDPGSATIALSGGGTHSGAFTLSTATSKVAFTGGTHNINSGASVTAGATGAFGLTAGTLNVNTPFTMPALSQSGGTLSGAATLTISSGFAWTGGDQDGGGSTQTGTSTVKVIPSSGSLHLTNRALAGSGTVTYNPTGTATLTLQTGAQWNLFGGSIDLQSDTAIASDGTASMNVTGGTLTKTTGTRTLVGPALYVNGVATLQPQGTTIAFGGGGSIGGTSVAVDTSVSGSQVEFAGGTTSLNGGTTITSGNVALTGGQLNLNTAATLSTFSQSGSSTLSGAQTLTAGTLNWTGGTMSGSGTTSIINTGFLSGSSTMTLSGWTLTNNGTVHYGPTAPLAVNSGAKINNNGTWALESGGALTSDLTGSPKFSNAGTLSKSIGGSTSFGVPILNTGGITLSGASILELTAGGQFTGGSVTTNVASDVVAIEANNVTISTLAPLFNGPGLVDVKSLGTLTNNVAASIPNLELDATGTIAGAGAFTVNNLKWTGGTMTGSGTTVVSVATNATALTAAPTLSSGRILQNNGTFNYNPAQSLTFSGSPAATFNNAGIFDVQGDGTTAVSGSGHLFENTGTFKKSSGPGTFTVSVPFDNNTGGTVDSQSPAGTLAFTAGSSQMVAGTMQASNATATIDFPSGTFTILGGAFAGPGPVRVNGGTLNVNGILTLPSDFEVSAGQLGGTAGLFIPNGAVFKWSGGTITGSSAIQVNSGGDFQADSTTSSLIFNGRTLIVSSGGNTHWSAGTNSLIFQSAAAVSNLGTFTVATNGTIGNATAGTFSNAGTFTHTGSGTLTLTMPVSNSTGGTWSEQGGTTILASTAGVTHTGTFDAQSGTLIEFTGGTHNFAPGAAFSAGTGIYKVAGATMSLVTNLTAPNFRLFSGALVGTGDLTTTSTFTWDGGQMAGSGTTTVASGTATLQSGALTLSRNLTLSGNTTFNDAGGLTVVGPAVLTNNATFDIQNGDVGCNCLPTAASFVNNGTLQGSVSPRRTVGVPISGSGTMNMASGWLAIENGAAFSTATIASGAILELGGTTSLGSVSGSGTLLNIGGATTVSGTTTLPNPGSIEIQSGTLTLNGTASAGTLLLKGGTVNGSGNIAADNLSWLAGALSGSGSATANTTLVLQGSSGAMTLSRPLVSTATSGVYTAPSAANALTVVAPGSITNNGSFQIASDFDLFASGAATFTNNGTVTRTSTATSNIGPAFTNAGTVSLGAGTTNFPNGYTQTAGTTTLGPGNLGASAIALNGGILNGNGTLTGPVTNAAALNPGTSPGAITINGNYTQTAAGTLNLDLNGITAGTQYDQLAVTGNVTLDGTLNATLGYTPFNGDVYDVLTFTGTRSGDFATRNLPTFPGSGTINAAYVSGPPQALRLTAVATQADLAAAYLLTPSLKVAGQNATFSLNVTNNGPAGAANVVVTDTPPPGFTLVSNSGGCTTAFPCNLGTIPAGQTVSITSTYAIPPGATGTVANSASVSSSNPDPNPGNNSATFPFLIAVQSDLAVTKSGPATATPNSSVAYDITVTNNGPSDATGVSLDDPTPARLTFVAATGACASFPCAIGSLPAGQSRSVHATYTVSPGPVTTITNTATVSSSSTDPSPANNSASASTSTGCTNTPPDNLLPANGVTNVATNGQLRWNNAGAASYNVYFGPAGSGCQTLAGTTSNNSFTYSGLATGAKYEWRVEAVTQGCPTLSSPCVTFTTAGSNACTTAPPPNAAVVGSAASAQVYSVLWEAVDGASRYEVDEATSDNFSDAKTTGTLGTHVEFQHNTTKPTAYYYRVRSFSACDQKLSGNSATLRVVILPPAVSKSPSANVPAGSNQVVIETVHVNGFPDGTFAFTATADKPWLSVTPSSGFLPPAGLDFQITADPTTLANGTATGTLILSLGAQGGSSRTAPNGATTVSVPVSVNLVTPVSPTTKSGPPANALIIPSVGHLDGLNSQWQSDIRVTNTSNVSARYQLTFTPADTTQSSKTTTITVAAGDTTALDDIVRNWYGSGALGDGANGVLEIRPQDSGVNITTVASSRTYNVTPAGTLGQFIPAIPFSAFIGKSGAVLGLQQIAQSAAYRTNFGVVEAGGKTAQVLVTGYSTAGDKLFETTLDLKPNEQRQINAFLASMGITDLADGRLEVKVTGGDGKVTAYASLVDNHSGDPLLISGVPLGAGTNTRYVLPGVADISNGLANWRSDVRVFNAGNAPQSATLTFYPLSGGGDPTTASIDVNPGETKQLDAILAKVFQLANTGGALHVTTPQGSQLIVSGRTYNLAADGSTYGQFIPAVTASDSVGKGGNALHVLQVEDSVRYRTNLGIAEVTGKPATVEVTVYVPDAKFAPKATLSLQPFEYRQYDILRSLGLENVYNARIAIRVTDGDGKVTAYGSVIDMTTQDPTYVPAQQ